MHISQDNRHVLYVDPRHSQKRERDVSNDYMKGFIGIGGGSWNDFNLV